MLRCARQKQLLSLDAWDECAVEDLLWQDSCLVGRSTFMMAWWCWLVSRLWLLTFVQKVQGQHCNRPCCRSAYIVPCHFGFRFCVSFILTETCIKPFWTTSIASSAGELGALTTCKPKPCNVSRRNHCTECQQAAHASALC